MPAPAPTLFTRIRRALSDAIAPRGHSGLRRLESRATIENPSVSLSDPASWDEHFGGGMATDAGVQVSHTGALKCSAVWSAVSMIADDVAKLPLDVYRRRQGTNGRDFDDRHPAWWVVRRKANSEQSAFVFWQTLMVHALIWGNGYAYILRNGRGEVAEMLPLLPDRTAPERINGQLWYTTETTRGGGPYLKALRPDEVYHIHGISIDGIQGCDLVEKFRNSVGLCLAAEGFSSKFFKHGARTSGILELPSTMTDKAGDKIEQGFRKFHEGPENWFKTVILREGAKFHQASVKPQEAEMTTTREQQVREIARWYRMPPSRLGIADSVSYNSKSEDNLAYLDSCLSPWLAAITAECWMKLLTEDQQDADSHYFEHNTGALLRMNGLQRHQVYAIGIRNSIYSPNEVRAMENMNPRDDNEGDKFAPLTKAPTGEPGSPGVDNGQNQNTSEQKSKKEDAQMSHEFRRAVFSLCSHARVKSAKPAAYIEWIDGGAVTHREEFARIGHAETFDRIMAGFRKLADTTTAAELSAAVAAASGREEAVV